MEDALQSGSTPAILLAEDSEDDYALMQRAIERAGITHQIRRVPTGERTLAYLKGEGIYADRKQYPFPDLLFLDLKMPRMNGFEVLQAIRKEPFLRRLIVIVVTSSEEIRDIDRAYEYGANSYLVKPVSFTELVEEVRLVKDYWLKINNPPGYGKG
jgi:CheY-like chemotaxis protein